MACEEVIIPSYRCEYWGTERLSDFLKATQLVAQTLNSDLRDSKAWASLLWAMYALWLGVMMLSGKAGEVSERAEQHCWEERCAPVFALSLCASLIWIRYVSWAQLPVAARWNTRVYVWLSGARKDQPQQYLESEPLTLVGKLLRCLSPFCFPRPLFCTFSA